MRLVTPTSLSTTLIVLSLWSSKPVAASIIPSKRTPSLIQHENAFVFAGDITLSAEATSPEVLILDFGQNMEGFPTFEVASTLGDTSKFEITFAESKDALGQYMSDGPLVLAAAMDTYRVKRHNITDPAVVTNRLIQGAFRYQKLNLSSSGSLTLRNVGVKPTTDTTPLTELPGAFECSDEDLNRIWHMGARSTQLNEIPQDTLPDFWLVTEEGALVDSLAPQVFAGRVTNYELSFEAKPLTGEFGFGVWLDTLNDGVYVSVDIISGAISAYDGPTTQDPMMASQPLPTHLSLQSWIDVHVLVNGSDMAITINDQTVLELSQTTYFSRSFGLGTSLGHATYFRNLRVEALDGTEVYASTLMDRSFLSHFHMGQNPADTIIDGSRRDRIAYNGDLDIALSATFASTFGTSFINGSLELLGSFQTISGFFIPTAKIQQAPLEKPINSNITGLIGYSFNLVSAMSQAFEMTGDNVFAQRWASAIVSMLDWAHSQTSNGLFIVSDPVFAGDWNYYDPPVIGASTKFNAAYAYSMQKAIPLLESAQIDASVYEERLTSLREAINTKLWNESLGVYVLSDEIRNGFSQDANAFAILAGVPQSRNISASGILQRLTDTLMLPAGPLAFSNSTTGALSGFVRKISPYASSYHLRAALESKNTDRAMELLKKLWAPMADPSHRNYTNCVWETLNPDGTPGLGLGTSLCHGWGAGPTAELTRHVLGIQPATPGFEHWTVRPLTMGLEWARGRMRTVRGDVFVEWRFENDLLRMEVEGPTRNSRGTVHLPEPLLTPVEYSVIRINGEITNDTSFTVPVGSKFVLEQSWKDCTGN